MDLLLEKKRMGKDKKSRGEARLESARTGGVDKRLGKYRRSNWLPTAAPERLAAKFTKNLATRDAISCSSYPPKAAHGVPLKAWANPRLHVRGAQALRGLW